MFYFAVAVILKDINDLEKVLAPFDENLKMPKYIKYTKAQAIKKVREEIESYKNNTYARYLSDKETYKLDWGNPNHIEYLENEFPKKLDWTDEECYQYEAKWYNDNMKDQEGNLYSTYNQNAKWNWWVLCTEDEYTRFKNAKMPLGYCKLKDFDKGLNKERYDYAIRFWEINVEGQPLKDGEKENDYFTIFKPKEYIEEYGNKKIYAKIQATPYWSFILNGEWYEKGKMDWFAAHDATKSSAELYLDKWNEVINDPKYQDYYIAIVECHI